VRAAAASGGDRVSNVSEERAAEEEAEEAFVVNDFDFPFDDGFYFGSYPRRRRPACKYPPRRVITIITTTIMTTTTTTMIRYDNMYRMAPAVSILTRKPEMTN